MKRFLIEILLSLGFYDRKILSNALPHASSSISLSRYRAFCSVGSSIEVTSTPQIFPVIRKRFGLSAGASLKNVSYVDSCSNFCAKPVLSYPVSQKIIASTSSRLRPYLFSQGGDNYPQTAIFACFKQPICCYTRFQYFICRYQ